MGKYDYTVIGSGPGGYVSAIRAAQLGLKSAVIEKAEVGGICLNWGCIPTKALLESAHFLAKLKKNRFGIRGIESPQADIAVMVKRSRDIASRLSGGIEHLLKKYKVELIRGEASFTSASTVAVKQQDETLSIESRFFCVATGARAKMIPGVNESEKIWTYRKAMTPPSLPENLLIVGGGAIGCEFADFYACAGSKVTLIEMAPQILPLEEADCAKVLKSELEKKGIKIRENASLETLREEEKIRAKIKIGDELKAEEFDAAIIAIGVTGNVENLGLEAAGIQVKRNLIPTEEFGRVPGTKNIFAIGDVTGGKQLAHKASREGVIAAEAAAHALQPDKISKPQPLLPENIPSCIYTSPQVASIGFTEKELIEKKIPYKRGEFPFMASGKALALESSRGFARSFVHTETGELLGAHLVGPDVTEIIGALSVARAGELTVDEFLLSVFPHPTISETLHEAIGSAMGESQNI